MTRDDLFNVNAGIAKGVVEACAKFCPDAVLRQGSRRGLFLLDNPKKGLVDKTLPQIDGL